LATPPFEDSISPSRRFDAPRKEATNSLAGNS
jgi:hypothetical protein